MSDRQFEIRDSTPAWEGRIVRVDQATVRFTGDATETTREIVRHPGSVATVAVDDRHVYLVLQPRPAVGEPDMLELPAGLRDKHDEPLEANAQRELAEEIGKRAERFEHLKTYFPSCGILDERMDIFLATGLSDAHADSGEDERIEVVAWPLDRLDEAIARTTDAKTIIGLMLLKDRLQR